MYDDDKYDELDICKCIKLTTIYLTSVMEALYKWNKGTSRTVTISSLLCFGFSDGRLTTLRFRFCVLAQLLRCCLNVVYGNVTDWTHREF